MKELVVFFGTVALLGAVSISGAQAETLNLTCTSADSSDARHIAIDLTSGLASNDTSSGGRRWAAVVTPNDVTWDEVYDSRGTHVANHYVLDRGTNVLHETDVARKREILTATCQKDS
ncbi:MAG: hypothetical protein ACREHE_15180 [Rhizomicrobium sp.]